MKFLEFMQQLTEEEKSGKIGFGVREKNSNKLIKFFSLHHLYTELKKFKETEENLLNLNSGKWFLSDEYEIDGKRFFSVMGKFEKTPANNDENGPKKPLKLKH